MAVLKWLGGKVSLLSQLTTAIPGEWSRLAERYYVEPFFGGGALFFHLAERPGLVARCSDANPELVGCWEQVRDQPRALFNAATSFDRDERTYYKIRDQFVPRSWGDDEALLRAARTIYLNKMGFNGLYRLGQHGNFNVPYCQDPGRTVAVLGEIERASRLLRGAELSCRDFEAAIDSAPSGSLVYADPPYVTLPGKPRSFTAYTGRQFTYADHERLACALERAAKWSWFLHSNSDTPWVRERYAAHRIFFVRGQRNVRSSADRTAAEVIVLGGPGVGPGRVEL